MHSVPRTFRFVIEELAAVRVPDTLRFVVVELVVVEFVVTELEAVISLASNVDVAFISPAVTV